MIPKRIIQTGKSRQLSPLEEGCRTNLTLLHPDWDYQFFDDNDVSTFVSKHFPQYVDIFSGFRYPIQKADFFRYLAVYHFGGFYFDTDVILSKPLDQLVDSKNIFTFEELTVNRFLREQSGMAWEIGNYAFGAISGDPFIKKIIENCVRGQQDSVWLEAMIAGIPRWLRPDFEILVSTGPGLVSRTLAESGNLRSGVTILMPENSVDPIYRNKFGSFGVHLGSGTWRRKSSPLKRMLGGIWEARSRRKSAQIGLDEIPQDILAGHGDKPNLYL